MKTPQTPTQRALARFKANRPALVSLVMLSAVVLLLPLWPWISAHSSTGLTDALSGPPGARHWFGTDNLGRDLLARVAYGSLISLMVGAVGALVSLVIGVVWGAVAGYVGGRVDAVMMRTVDILYSLPSIVFVIVIITTVEGLFKTWLEKAVSPQAAGAARLLFLFAGLGAVSWLTMARIVRGQVLALKNRAFVDAARALGASHASILWRHILPNVSGVIITYVTLTIPSIVLYESFLSYLGLGVQPPQASLGSLMAEGVAQINPIRVYWWMIVFPGASLTGLLLMLNLIGDGLRDAFDPSSESRH